MDRNGPKPLFLKARCDQNIEEPFDGYSGFMLLTLPELFVSTGKIITDFIKGKYIIHFRCDLNDSNGF